MRLLSGLLTLGLLALRLGSASAGVPTQMPLEPDRGRALYRENCWPCHGYTGEGNGPVAAALPKVSPPLAGRIAEADYDKVAAMILTGKGDMPGFSQVMDRHDARRILVWLATLDPEHPHDPADDKPKDDKAKDDKAKDDKDKDKDNKAEGDVPDGAEGGDGEP